MRDVISKGRKQNGEESQRGEQLWFNGTKYWFYGKDNKARIGQEIKVDDHLISESGS